VAISSVQSPALLNLQWWRDASPAARRALVAASMGWLLDSFDVMLYALVLATLMADLNMSAAVGGSLASLTLAASAVGGVLFGVFADRFGRVRALVWSVLIYSVFTAACGLAQSVRQLAVFRVFLGIGMGGEWASGAALVSETWPAEHRGKALGLVQSSWAIGYAAAAVVTALVLPTFGWRAVFFVGILPALFTVWVRRKVDEPEVWRLRARDGATGRLADVFAPGLRGLTVAVTLMNACIMFAWWGFNLWIPAYLSLPVEQGGIGLSAYAMSGLVIAMQVGMWFGYVLFGFVSDRIGRKRTYVVYVLTAAALILAYTATRNPMALLVLGPLVAFFGTGSFSGFGAVTAEIYPTEIRATAQGFTYNIGRLASAVAPFIVGTLAQTQGFAAALSIASAAFVLAAVCWIWIPETKGRELL
jgi:MFS family permease|tara:strand:- start:52 stop:1305 length:1254 start_codon:yes stop_codon:yes gene_type:complete